jgi:hypothetical protein
MIGLIYFARSLYLFIPPLPVYTAYIDPDPVARARMNRRGHLSSKIPNVKLRPVPVGVPARTRGVRRSASPLSGMDAIINRREMEGEEGASRAYRVRTMRADGR